MEKPLQFVNSELNKENITISVDDGTSSLRVTIRTSAKIIPDAAVTVKDLIVKF